MALRTLALAASAAALVAVVAAEPPAHATVRGPAPERPAEPRRVVSSRFSHLPPLFVENRGQTDARVVAYASGRGRSVYLTPGGVTYALSSGGKRWAVKADFVGADPDVRPELGDEAPTVMSWFKGPKTEWKTGVRTFRAVAYRDLWPGIDLVWTAATDELKYAFVVRPGADPSSIRIAWSGGTDVSLDAAGALTVATPVAGLRDEKPFSYQDVDGRRVEIASSYALGGKTARGDRVCGFGVGAYDRSLPLVVDPASVVYAGFLGGDDEDIALGIAADADGAAYVAGYTRSTDGSFPTVVGPDLTENGVHDAFVAKVRPDGTALEYVGYIGGVDEDHASAIAIDSAKNAYVTGYTNSTETSFPVVTGPRVVRTGAPDGWIAKVNAAGTGLVYCGYLGGPNVGNGIAVDKDGNAYVVGTALLTAGSVPVKVGPVLTKAVGDTASFVMKIKADGTDIVYAGYVAGSGDSLNERGNGVAVDDDGAAYVVGTTFSSTFPATVGPDLVRNGYDGFIAKVRPDGTGFVYAGFIGGTNGDKALAVAVDANKNAYVTGSTSSDETSFPVLVGPDLTRSTGTNPSSITDAFVAKVKADGTGLDYCGYIGGKGDETGTGIAVNAAGEAWVTGRTLSDQTSFPVVGGPALTFHGPAGVEDAFVAHVSASGASLISCGYVGGSGQDLAYAIAVDAAGDAYVTGSTQSDAATFPDHTGPILVRGAGSLPDAFVAKITGVAPPPPPATNSYLLPAKVTAKFNAKNAALSKLTVTGVFDIGSIEPCWKVASTLDVGGLHFAIPAFTAGKTVVKKYVYAADGLTFTVTPNAHGSSKAAFALTYVGDLTGKIAPDGQLVLRFADDAGTATATVDLAAGKFKLAAPHGGIVDPCIFIGHATAGLLGPGKDTLSLTLGFATDGTPPAIEPCWKVGFGDTFLQDIPAAAFHAGHTAAQRVAKGNFGGITSVTVDYAKQTVSFTGKGLTLGTFAQGANTVLVQVTIGTDVHAVRVVLARAGSSMSY